jgi:hypothetical protein
MKIMILHCIMILSRVFLIVTFLGLLLLQFHIHAESPAFAFKPSSGDESAGNPPSSTTTAIPRPSGQSNLTGAAQQESSSIATHTGFTSPPLGIYYYDFPGVNFSSEQVLVQLSNGTGIEVPKTQAFDNGTTIDTLACIKTMTPAYGPDDAIVSCGPFIRTYQ